MCKKRRSLLQNYFWFFTTMVYSSSCALVLTILARWASAACIPDVPEELLGDSQILDHPAILKAFDEVEKLLQKPYDDNITQDGLSFAIVCALLL
jgi:hypothetical protein